MECGVCAGMLPVGLAIPGVGAETKCEESEKEKGQRKDDEFHDVWTFWCEFDPCGRYWGELPDWSCIGASFVCRRHSLRPADVCLQTNEK